MKSTTEFDILLGKELYRLRKSNNRCQKELYTKLGLNSQQQLSLLEKGKKHFTDDIIFAVSNFFGISIMAFINAAKQLSQKNYTSFDNEFAEIEQTKNPEIKLILFKKLAIESKIEAINLKLQQLGNFPFTQGFQNSKHKVYVLA